MSRIEQAAVATCLTDTIECLSPREFDSLDERAGAAGCYHRLRQRESDGRWNVRYAVRKIGTTPVAAVPGYTRLGTGWPDPDYDIRGWQLPDDLAPAQLTSDRCLFVGGCADLRSGLHIGPAARTEPSARAVLSTLARTAAEREQCLVFPYVFAPDRELLVRATSGSTVWTSLGCESRFPDVLDPNREDRIGARVRGVLRRDARLIAAAGVRTEVCAWADVPDAAELIAAHNIGKGSPDHPEFVALRHEQWAACESVEVVVFTASSGAARGVLSALVWSRQLELYEVGLTGREGPDRLAVYLDLLFHQPMRFAREQGLTTIRAGLAAEVPKRSRGAVTHHVSGGILGKAATLRLADEQS
jgi:hypothetical protein